MKSIRFIRQTAAALIIAAVATSASCDRDDPATDPTVDPVKATGVSLNKSELTLTEGDTETLAATVAPDNATNQAVKWESSNPNVATVVSTGLVTAIAPGSTTVVVTTQDGHKTAACAVTVVPDVPSGPYMTMSLQPSGSATIALIGSGTATINWGDGVIIAHTLTESASSYSHDYSGTAAVTITIAGNDISQLLCNNNRLTGLDVSNNTKLTYLYCESNQLTSLDVSKNTMLHCLRCSENRLTSLDVTQNTALAELFCSDNRLTSLDVSKNIVLRNLTCRTNELTSVDVAKNTALTLLYCDDNRLTSLNMSKNTALAALSCGYNRLTSLNVTNNTALVELYCSGNQLTTEELNALFGSLPGNTGDKTINIGGNLGAATCNRTIATDKGWTVRN